MIIDPLKLSKDLMVCPSVSPHEAGALDVLCEVLAPMGFICHRVTFTGNGSYPVDNLYAEWGHEGPNLCFAGHVDVVPPGPLDQWSHDPFGAEVKDGYLYGRGAVDMKPAIAAFVAAVGESITKGTARGRLSLLITCDEEADAVNGTQQMVAWLKENGKTIEACVVGEPTNPSALGEMIKIGRRGSLSFHLEVVGKQGHVAYPKNAANPIPILMDKLYLLTHFHLDEGNAYFDPSHLEITTVDVGNKAGNVIPALATAAFNIRYNTLHTEDDLIARLRQTLQVDDHVVRLRPFSGAKPFLTEPGRISEILKDSITKVTGHVPVLSTTGGTSDARFLHEITSVVEFGLVNITAHQIDECVAISDIKQLQDIYALTIKGFFTKLVVV